MIEFLIFKKRKFLKTGKDKLHKINNNLDVNEYLLAATNIKTQCNSYY